MAQELEILGAGKYLWNLIPSFQEAENGKAGEGDDKVGDDEADDEDDNEEEAEIDTEEERDWENITKEELLQKAKDMGLSVNPNMSKEELIKVIREAE